jgi:type IV secretion system protein VirB4
LLDKTLQEALRTLIDSVQTLIQQMSGVVGAEVLDKKEAFRFLRRVWNPDRTKAEAVPLVSDLHVDFFAVDSELECHRDYLRLGGHFVKTLTMKRPSVHTYASILRELRKVGADMIVSTEWQVIENTRAIGLIRSQRRHWHSAKTSLWAYAVKEPVAPEDILVDPSKKALVDDLGNCLTDMEMKGTQVGYFTLSIKLYGPTLEDVRRATAEVMRVFGAHEAVLNDECYNGLNAFLASQPTGHPFNLRRLITTNLNHVDMGPWSLPSEGDRWNPFLKQPYLIAVETEDRSIYYLNLHVGDVGHTGVFGPTGTGKSFLLNCLLTHFQAYRPYIFIYGSGGDFRWLTKHLGGSYLRCRPGKQDFRMNPFLLPATEENLQFQSSFAELLCDGPDQRLNESQRRELYEAIRYLPVLPPELRRPSTLATTVSKAIGDRLKPWTEGEKYGAWFDNPVDTFRAERIQCVDFEGMKNLGSVFERVLFYLLHRANEVIYDDNFLTTLKLLLIDEAWLLFQHPITKAYIIEALKGWRKRNGTVVLATQSVKDLAEADIVRPVVESCPTKLLLANPDMDPKLYADVLGLTPIEQDKVKGLVSKRQFLLKRDGFSKVLNLNVDRKSYWLFTTNPFEAERREKVIAKLGLEAGLEALKEELPG